MLNPNPKFLILFFNDNTHHIHNILPHMEDLSDIEIMKKLMIEHETIKKKIIISEDKLGERKYWDCIILNNNGEIDFNKEKVIKVKLKEIRDNRNNYWQSLDTNYIIALQRKDINKQNIIAQKSEYLRNITNIDFTFLSPRQIIDYNPFLNFTIN